MAEKGPLSGKLLGGKYLLGDILGEGAFGTVYSAYHQQLQRTQAIKVFQERHFREPKFRDRFLREAQIVAALDHVNIVHIDDFGIEEQESRAYLVMSYVRGGTFHQFLEKRREGLSLQQTTTYLEQICAALGYAHQQNVVHLDLKPLNLLIHTDGRLLLSDFGLAHLLEKDMLQGESSLGLGTPYYMAPEHFRHQPGKGSDIYALGVLLYRMLTGRLPFVGDNYWDIMSEHMNKPVPALQIVRPELPRGLEEIIQRALAKQVTQRYQTADELLTAFKNVLALEKEQAARTLRQAEERKQKALEDQARKLSEQIELAKLRQNELAQFHEAELQRVREEFAKQKKMVEEAKKKEESNASISPSASTASPVDALDTVLPPRSSFPIQPLEKHVNTKTPTPISAHPLEMTPRIAVPPDATFINQAAVPPLPPEQTRNPFPTQTRLHIPQKSFSRKIMLVLLVLVLLVGASAGVIYTAGKITRDKAQATIIAQAYAQATATLQTQQAAFDAYNHAAATNGVMFGFNAQHTRANPYEQILSPTTVSALTKKWVFSSGDHISSSPAVVNGVVYVGSDDHNLYAIDATSGTKKWVFSTGGGISSSPAVVNGVVYVGSWDHSLYALDATSGKKLWSFQTGSSIWSSPVVANGVVYVGSIDGKLYAIDEASGTKKWVFSTGDTISSSPAVVHGVVYVGSWDHKLYAIDAASGTKKWVFSAGDTISSSPAVVNGVVYVGSVDGKLYAIDAASGTKKWVFSAGGGITSSPAVVNGVVYVGSWDHNLYALDAASGSKKWAFSTRSSITSSPAVANGVVYVGSDDGNWYALDAASGTGKWAYQTGSSITSSPAVVNGVIYVGSWDHNLYAFHLP